MASKTLYPEYKDKSKHWHVTRAGFFGIGWMSSFIIIAALVVFHIYAYTHFPFTVTTGFFAVTMVAAFILTLAAARGSDYTENLPIPEGKIVAVIPAYNENPEILRETIHAMLNNTIVPDVIHVVDDGSVIPVETFEHPLIVWHRQDNAGKRMAQYNVLKDIDPQEYPYLLTVDSDSVISPTAIEASMRAFGDPEVHAVTSVVTTRHAKSLIGRLIDLEMVSGIYSLRRARARFGVVTPTSGALSMYRTQTITDNLDDYITSGTFSDDRRMAHYSLMRGKVVVANGAIVASDMPETAKGTWRQRVRWYKGYWKYLNWELINLDGAAFWLRLYNTVLAAVFPILMFWVAVWLPLTGRPFFWPVFVLWLALLYGQSVTYLRRPYKSFAYKFLTWLFLTPLLIPFQLFLVRPAMYWAFFTQGSDKWDGHRVNGVAEALKAQQAK